MSNFHGKVAPEWFARGVPLFKAAQAFGRWDHLARLQDASKQFAEMRGGETPEAFEPVYKPSRLERDAEVARLRSVDEQRTWDRVRAQRMILQMDLVHRLRLGDLRAFGDPGFAGALTEWIEVRSWYYLKPDPTDSLIARGEGAAYFFVHVVEAVEHKAQEASQPPVKAADEQIAEAVLAVYQQGAQPNLNHVWPLVREELSRQGLTATKIRVQDIAGRPEFAALRVPSGHRKTAR